MFTKRSLSILHLKQLVITYSLMLCQMFPLHGKLIYDLIAHPWNKFNLYYLSPLCSFPSSSFMIRRHLSIHLLDTYHQPKLINAEYDCLLWIKIVALFFSSFSCFGLFMQIKDAIISHGCFLRECSVQHSIVGERSRLDFGVELQVNFHGFQI